MYTINVFQWPAALRLCVLKYGCLTRVFIMKYQTFYRVAHNSGHYHCGRISCRSNSAFVASLIFIIFNSLPGPQKIFSEKLESWFERIAERNFSSASSLFDFNESCCV